MKKYFMMVYSHSFSKLKHTYSFFSCLKQEIKCEDLSEELFLTDSVSDFKKEVVEAGTFSQDTDKKGLGCSFCKQTFINEEFLKLHKRDYGLCLDGKYVACANSDRKSVV